MIMKTQKSYHVYWFMDSTAKVERSCDTEQLAKTFSGDPVCVNESRVMRLPGFMHCKKETPVEVPCVASIRSVNTPRTSWRTCCRRLILFLWRERAG